MPKLYIKSVQDTFKVAVVDDHVLLRKGLCELIIGFGNYVIQFEADNGQDFVSKINPSDLPDAVLMDVNMPLMDGYEATAWIKQYYPAIKVLILSMYDNETSIIRMFRAGARGYILKDCDPRDLKSALISVITKEYYYSDLVSSKLINNIRKQDDNQSPFQVLSDLNEREITFLKHACSELTYKEIADKMFLSPRTIDGYRDALFEKLGVSTRVGLVLYAIKHGIVVL